MDPIGRQSIRRQSEPREKTPPNPEPQYGSDLRDLGSQTEPSSNTLPVSPPQNASVAQLSVDQKRLALEEFLLREGAHVLQYAQISQPRVLRCGLRNVTICSQIPSEEPSLLRASVYEPAFGDHLSTALPHWSRYHKELAVSALLTRHGVPTPPIRRIHYFEAVLGVPQLVDQCAACIADYLPAKNLEDHFRWNPSIVEQREQLLNELGSLARSIHNIPTRGFGHLWDTELGRFQYDRWVEYVEDFFFPEQIDALEAIDVLDASDAEKLRERYQEASCWDVSPRLAHGDLAPRNVLLLENEKLSIIDLELAFSGPALQFEISQILLDELLSAEPSLLAPILDGIGISKQEYRQRYQRDAETLAAFTLLARIYPSFWAHHPAKEKLPDPPFFSKRAAVPTPNALWREEYRLRTLLSSNF